MDCSKILLYWAIACCFVACSTPPAPTLDNFDSKTWIKDRLGCKGERAKLFASLTAQKEKLKGLGQNQILSILGKPDFHELASRNQRFYIYYYNTGHQCKGGTPNIRRDSVFKVRFSPLNAVNEITW